MKKVLSFVCCLFMAVSCFVPFVSAYDTPMHDRERCYFTLKSRPDMGLSILGLGDGSQAVGHVLNQFGEVPGGWFTAYLKNGAYTLWFGKQFTPIFWRAQVLDEDRGSNRIATWANGWADHQKWVFEAAPAYPYYRIKNVGTGRYLTYDPPTGKVWGYQWCATDNQIWQKH